MQPMVKICGFMRPEDVRMCIRQGASIIGFVVEYPHRVPWNLKMETAQELMAEVTKPTRTCVVTGGSLEKIVHIAQQTKPDYIQLHFGETLAEVSYLVKELGKYGTMVIKTLFPDTPDLEKAAADFSQTGIYALLFDPRSPNNAVASGTADLSVFAKIQRSASCPVILAGGITAENVAKVVAMSKAPIIDLMSGVECSHGVKDETKVVALFQALRNIS